MKALKAELERAINEESRASRGKSSFKRFNTAITDRDRAKADLAEELAAAIGEPDEQVATPEVGPPEDPCADIKEKLKEAEEKLRDTEEKLKTAKETLKTAEDRVQDLETQLTNLERTRAGLVAEYEEDELNLSRAEDSLSRCTCGEGQRYKANKDRREAEE